MTRWRTGDLCRVSGEGDEIYRVREAGSTSAYLERVDGSDGVIGHGREGFGKLTRVTRAEARRIAARLRRMADALDPSKDPVTPASNATPCPTCDALYLRGPCADCVESGRYVPQRTGYASGRILYAVTRARRRFHRQIWRRRLAEPLEPPREAS